MRRIMSGVLAAAVVAAAGLLACGDSGTDPDPEPETGTVSGSVQASGSPVAGATVTLSSVGSTTTSSTGNFAFQNVEVGTYTVTLTVPSGLELDGEETAKSVTVTANQTATVSWTLRDPDATVVQEIRLAGVSFTPQNVTIAPGTTVRWIWDDGTHTVTPDDPNQTGVWAGTDLMGPGSTFEHTFTVAGQTYDYHCQPHVNQGMVGTITVSN